MQSPKEQHSKSAEMDSETPVLVLKPSAYGILKRLFLISIIVAVFLCESLSFNWKYMSFDKTMNLSACVVIIYFGIIIVETLFVKSFKLYPDRAEKCYVFWKKVIWLKDARVSMVFSKIFGSALYVTPNSSSYFYCRLKRVRCDFGLEKGKIDAIDVVSSCRSIGIELEKSANFFGEQYEQI